MRKHILILGHNDATQFIDIYNQYTRLFDKDKYEVTVVYLTGEPNETVRQRTIAEQVVFLNQSKKDIRTLKMSPIRKLLALCREKRFQIVICHRYKPTYIMMWVAQFYKIPALLFVMHELGTMSSINRQLTIACLGRKNMLFAGVSNAVRDDIHQSLWRMSKERVATLYNMIDMELTEPQLLSRKEARLALNLPEDAFVFGNIARLAPNKDQENLIRAFSLIKPYCPQAKLIIIGNGDLAPRLKEQVKTVGLCDDILFTGFLPGGFRYMKAFDCFVLSSIQEAFGRVLLEAMMARLPIIATRVHGIPEVVGEAGVLIKPKDASAFASAMKQVYTLSEQEREHQGEKAYQRVVNHFSIPIFHEQFWQLPLVQPLKE
jgi:glycosyltransferase involved in cell wall biosynthesis